MPERRVAVIGGGASGVLAAVHLLRCDPDPALHVDLYDTGTNTGVGVAYSTTDRRHLLNVSASNMSAFPDEPGDLLAWTAEVGRPARPLDFLPRVEYGRYLGDRLAERGGDRLRFVTDEVVDIEPTDEGYLVHATTGRPATTVVLAYGNLAPRPLTAGPGDLLPDAGWHLANPWRLDEIRAQFDDATVLLVGSGLTAIDTAVTLLGDSDDRRVVMLSRHGLLPYRHATTPVEAWRSPMPRTGPLTADELAQVVVDQIEIAARQGVNWRAVIDGLRGDTQQLWVRLSLDERRRFLHTYARSWEVRRHRMAPEIAERLDGWRAEGRLDVLAGTISDVVPDDDHGCLVRVVSLPVVPDPFHVCAVVNCTGPATDIRLAAAPLLQSLVKRGLVTPDELRLGIETDDDGAVTNPAGAVVPGLFAVGPPRKGMLYESTAVPEIRVQAAALADRLRRTRRRARGRVIGG